MKKLLLSLLMLLLGHNIQTMENGIVTIKTRICLKKIKPNNYTTQAFISVDNNIILDTMNKNGESNTLKTLQNLTRYYPNAKLINMELGVTPQNELLFFCSYITNDNEVKTQKNTVFNDLMNDAYNVLKTFDFSNGKSNINYTAFGEKDIFEEIKQNTNNLKCEE